MQRKGKDKKMSEHNKVTRSLPIPSNPQIVPFSKLDRDIQASRKQETQAFKERYSPEIALIMAAMTPRERAGKPAKKPKGEKSDKKEKKEQTLAEFTYTVGRLNGDGGTHTATAKTMMIRYTDPETGELKWFPKMSFDYKVSEWKQMLTQDALTYNICLGGEAIFLFIWFEVKEQRSLGTGLTWRHGKVEAYASMKDAEKARDYWMNKPVDCTVEFLKNFTKSNAYALAKRSARG